ncbi:hypothetical protein MA16_Dca022823 [Dendrobium catenatum]|uniref:Uncharacterized protein n=1 Tax=Dendrobium catenatum TaxID=906689 RepID=A0A2I0VIA8_9ASPA|nr:hypothetical protein MA16_Dca022823 [Dendrobium catenatum]
MAHFVAEIDKVVSGICVKSLAHVELGLSADAICSPLIMPSAVNFNNSDVVAVVDMTQNPLVVDVDPMDTLVAPVVVPESVAPSCTTPCLLVSPDGVLIAGKLGDVCVAADAPSVCIDGEGTLPTIVGLVKKIDGRGVGGFEVDDGGETGAILDTTVVFCALYVGDVPLSKSFEESLLNVPLTLVSKDDLHTHISRDSEMMQGDRLHADNSSADGEDFYEDDLASRTKFFKRSGKCRARNSKKK